MMRNCSLKKVGNSPKSIQLVSSRTEVWTEFYLIPKFMVLQFYQALVGPEKIQIEFCIHTTVKLLNKICPSILVDKNILTMT